MGLDEPKMNKFSSIMQPGLNYKEMRCVSLWSVLFLGVPIAWFALLVSKPCGRLGHLLPPGDAWL